MNENEILEGEGKTVISNINAIISEDIHKIWDIILAVDKYNTWRSDLCKTEIMNGEQVIEYTKNGYATAFSVTVFEPYECWDNNSNLEMTAYE